MDLQKDIHVMIQEKQKEENSRGRTRGSRTRDPRTDVEFHGIVVIEKEGNL